MGKSKATVSSPTDPYWYMGKTSFSVTKEKIGYNYESFLPTIDLIQQSTYYLLVVEYTTGNSFGRDSEPRYEIIDAYVDIKDAFENGNHIKAHAAQSRFSHSGKKDPLDVTLSNGTKLKYAAWDGYFEHLDRVFIKTFVATDYPDFIEIE